MTVLGAITFSSQTGACAVTMVGVDAVLTRSSCIACVALSVAYGIFIVFCAGPFAPPIGFTLSKIIEGIDAIIVLAVLRSRAIIVIVTSTFSGIG